MRFLCRLRGRCSICRKDRRAGFTLVELLVAVVIVGLLVFVVGVMTNSTVMLIRQGNKKMDADGEARTVFDRMATDFTAMVKRSDVDYQFDNRANTQNGNAALFFYSEAPAISASANMMNNGSISLVGYRVNASYQLERLGKGLQWTPNGATSIDGSPDGIVYLTYATSPVTNTSVPVAGSTLADAFPSVLAPGSTDANYHVLSEGVFRFQFWFLLKPYRQADGSYAPAVYSNFPYDARRQHTSLTGIGLADVQAIVVSLGVLDAASRQLLPPGLNWAGLVAALPDPSEPFANPGWEKIVASGTTLVSAGLPAAVAGQVRVYTRTFNLVTPDLP